MNPNFLLRITPVYVLLLRRCTLFGVLVGLPRRQIHARLLLGPGQGRACGLPVQPVVPSPRVAPVYVGEFCFRAPEVDWQLARLGGAGRPARLGPRVLLAEAVGTRMQAHLDVL